MPYLQQRPSKYLLNYWLMNEMTKCNREIMSVHPDPVLVGFRVSTYQFFGLGNSNKSKQELGQIEKTRTGLLPPLLRETFLFECCSALGLHSLAAWSSSRITDSCGVKDLMVYLLSFLHLHMTKLSDFNPESSSLSSSLVAFIYHKILLRLFLTGINCGFVFLSLFE